MTTTTTATIEEAQQWQEDVKTWYASSTARNRSTAAKQLVPYLDKDDSRKVVEVIKLLPELGRRFQVRNPAANPVTVQTYIARVNSLLTDFLIYKEDPKKLQGHLQGRPIRRRPKKAAPEPQIKPRQKTKALKKAPPSPQVQAKHQLHLPDGKSFGIEIPQELLLEDVERLAWQLRVLCVDFDPASIQMA